MAHGPRYHVPFRRRREGKTDYRARLALLKSKKPRATVRKSLSGVLVQVIECHEGGDRVLVQASYKDLKKMGWEHSLKDTSASYLVGLMAGVRAGKSNIGEAVLDIGIQEPTKGNKIFATLKGLLDGGLDIPHGKGMFPKEERIMSSSKDIKGFRETFESMKSKIMEM
ncbi:MAG: 50S ribosomal protein L18 [Candidatus Thermoplasmatota archaeon]|nr:50S ribosomal protein L18 [Candidatus Thermoplasmatota archaeon]